MEKDQRVKKINRFRDGRIWLNVLKSNEGAELFTLNRSFKDSNGQWKSSDFFRQDGGDLRAIRNVLDQYEQSCPVKEEEVVQGP